jgi:hypothetical protein
MKLFRLPDPFKTPEVAIYMRQSYIKRPQSNTSPINAEAEEI